MFAHANISRDLYGSLLVGRNENAPKGAFLLDVWRKLWKPSSSYIEFHVEPNEYKSLDANTYLCNFIITKDLEVS